MMSNTPIFIHSLFRTGSTYIWKKFRDHGGYWCYYEPLHQELAELHKGKVKLWDIGEKAAEIMHHPVIDTPHHFEYEHLLKDDEQGLPFFKKAFSFDEFFHTEENPDLKQYIDYLMEGAGGKRPLFQFNRSAMRVSWFRNTYPGSLNIYLARNPRDQWQSCCYLAEKHGQSIFLVMDLLLVSKNCRRRENAWIDDYVPLIDFDDSEFRNEAAFFETILRNYSREDLYLVFYHIWFMSLLENIKHADMIINMDLLSSSVPYTEHILENLSINTIDGINFSDFVIKKYINFDLKVGVFDELENIVHHNYRTMHDFALLERLGDEGKRALGLSRDAPEKGAVPASAEELKSKYRAIIKSFGTDMIHLKEKIRTIESKIDYFHMNIDLASINKIDSALSGVIDRIEKFKEDEKRLTQQLQEKDRQLRHVYSSYTYKVGNFLLWPVKKILGK